MDTKKLRQKILDLAIRGKLVPQDPNDEPASVLLQRIRAEKERLIKEGKIKRSKRTTSDEEIEAPFEIPESWVWTRLCDITELIEDCPHSTAKDEGHGYPLIRTPNIGEGYLILDGVHRVSETVYNKRNARAVPEANDIIYAREAPAGNAAVIKEGEIVCLGQRTVLIRPFKDYINSKLLTYFIISPHSRNSLVSTAVGSTATHVNLENIRPFSIPIPPLVEQKRIANEVERWFSLIDALENNECDLLKSIDKAKSKILDLAIHGKLVPQDPNDEPAIELLKRINPKFEPCENEDCPFEIPNTWEWLTLDDVCDVARGGSPRPIKDYLTDADDGINWIKIGDTEKNGKYINSAKERIKPEGKSKSRYVHKGDFLLTNSMSFGHPYILNIDGCIHDGWLVISPLENAFNRDFLYHLLSSDFVYKQFSEAASGGVVSNLNSEKVAHITVPLAPYQEQLRIVSKIEELFAILDNIKESLE